MKIVILEDFLSFQPRKNIVCGNVGAQNIFSCGRTLVHNQLIGFLAPVVTSNSRSHSNFFESCPNEIEIANRGYPLTPVLDEGILAKIVILEDF